MTYRKLFYLKYMKGISTSKLMEQYPDEIRRVSEVALLDVEEETLRHLIVEEETLNRLMRLREEFFEKDSSGKRNPRAQKTAS